MKYFTIILLCMTFLAACTSTKVTNVRYEKGKLLKQETSPEVLDRTEYELNINSNSVSLNEKHIYVAKEVKIYEKIKSTNLRTEGTTMTDSPFWAVIGTPGALFLDVMTLGMMGATAEIWTKDSNDWKTVKDKLENDFFVDEKDVFSAKKTPISMAKVQLQIGDETAQVVTTNTLGNAKYSFAEVLYNSSIVPEQLIKNQGVQVTAMYNGVKKSKKFANKDIPEQYFAMKFNDMRESLSQRTGRFGNCEFIAKDKREFFECYYE